jgi:hypothetical protein
MAIVIVAEVVRSPGRQSYFARPTLVTCETCDAKICGAQEVLRRDEAEGGEHIAKFASSNDFAFEILLAANAANVSTDGLHKLISELPDVC